MELIDLDILLNKLKVTYEQLIEIGILLGSDYADTIKGVGIVSAYKYILKYGSIENMRKNNLIKEYNYEEAKEYFKTAQCNKNISNKDVFNKKIKLNKLRTFLDKHGFKDHKIINKHYYALGSL